MVLADTNRTIPRYGFAGTFFHVPLPDSPQFVSEPFPGKARGFEPLHITAKTLDHGAVQPRVLYDQAAPAVLTKRNNLLKHVWWAVQQLKPEECQIFVLCESKAARIPKWPSGWLRLNNCLPSRRLESTGGKPEPNFGSNPIRLELLQLTISEHYLL